MSDQPQEQKQTVPEKVSALSQAEVRAIAEYARMALSDEELTEMTRYLNDAIHMLEPIRQYQLDGVEPTFHPIGAMVNVMRKDEVKPGLSRQEALSQAASTKDIYFRVPSILGTGELS